MSTRALDVSIRVLDSKDYMNGLNEKEYAVFCNEKRKRSVKLCSSSGVPLLLYPSFQAPLIDYQLNSF